MDMRLITTAALALAAGTANADFNLQITEMWAGNEPGNNLTEDWFELTNLGTSAFTFGVDGDLYFDDESFDPTVADLLEGISTIAPGESVVFIDEGPDGVDEWLAVWTEVLPAALPQVGFYDGSGLGGGGDGVGIFLDDDADGDFNENDLIDTAEYPDAANFGGQSWDVPLSAFSTVGNQAGAIATLQLNSADQPAIASPGTIPAAPTAALLALTGIAATKRRRA